MAAPVDSETALVFVYGSLKHGFALHHLLAEQTFLGRAETVGRYRIFDLGRYPGLLARPADGLAVIGEVYRVCSECLAQLDLAEGVDEGLYSRDRLSLAAPFENEVVWGYIYLGSIANCRDCGQEWP